MLLSWLPELRLSDSGGDFKFTSSEDDEGDCGGSSRMVVGTDEADLSRPLLAPRLVFLLPARAAPSVSTVDNKNAFSGKNMLGGGG